MKPKLKHRWLCIRERVIIYSLICFFLLSFVFLLAGIETVVEYYPYHVLAVISLALLSFFAANKITNKL